VARELFARQGVQRTSLREIADHLGITKPALYYHFDSREALVASIVEPLLADRESQPALSLAERQAARRPSANGAHSTA
jgi:AcrR family transcriptional regulator